MRRDSTANQGYCGRKSSNGGYGGSKDEMGNIWEVVSALAKALQDAHNQLVRLMHPSKSDPLRLSGGQRCIDQCCCSRTGTPSRAAVRNLHHGHVAFGASSEYPLTPRCSRMSSQQAHSSPPAPAGRRCTHPLHGVGAEARKLLHPSWPSGAANGCRKSHCDDQPRVDRACIHFGSEKDQAAGSCHDSSPDLQRRKQHHCMAKQFAALLSHEAHQQHERRLTEEVLRDKRPSWSRF